MLIFVIVFSIFFSSSSQLLLKKGAAQVSIPPQIDFANLTRLLGELVFNVYLVSGVIFQVIALLSWIYILKKVDVSFAYPFISLGFIFVMFMGYLLFNEPLTLMKVIGTLVIILGVIIMGKA
ncbi:hypothetical protein CKY10_14190 [Photorhabdus sp. HUG-39]|uniref:EamA family transporter n=2 Tax=Photorhabdus TaxID=29487 RepID=A0ABX0B794_9GAMM|nr:MULTISPECIES: EamA family transporter [Photorhabdus]MCC8375630.1 EamA family transporter [Photorhabdus bodei]MDB6374974.1 EamA family transporter [Photorhabdus bodei]NDL12825.1 EamA family transporter [Photorhabdus kayaii]NDL26591.1 EamA family transporter [Photorhabdus kayaii]RAX08801.1 hypothetical protein CKY10_14190 [Photorhabdus sp. HUG-39]